MSSTNKEHLFLPQLISDRPGRWHVEEVDIRQSGVNNKDRQARVPRAHTEAQRLARLHEATHAKHSPIDLASTLPGIVMQAVSLGMPPIDPQKALRVNAMLEENRIDWLLWDKYHEDSRPSRESLDWGRMPVPADPFEAMLYSLQLMWTVEGHEFKVPNAPAPRVVDNDAAVFYEKCVSKVMDYNRDLGAAIVEASKRMYLTPTDEARDRAAAELTSFWPVEVPKEQKQPPKKAEQKEAEAEAEKAEAEADAQRRDEEGAATKEPGLLELSSEYMEGSAEIHDHTAGIRRPSMRIARRDVPQQIGTRLVFPHRYMIDKGVFARRVLTEGGIMVDGSGSMRWSNTDLANILDVMPAVWIGLYSGFSYNYSGVTAPKHYTPDMKKKVYGRICILAKNGRFAKFEKKDPGSNGYNAVDVEALIVLAKWPRPRFWLSDGLVCDGVYEGKPPLDPRWEPGDPQYNRAAIIDRVNAIMKRNEILRVPDKQTMFDLVRKRRVTVYRSTVDPDHRSHYPKFMNPEPTVIQL